VTPIAELPRLRLYYEIQGAGDPVVMISGLGADAHFWHKQAPTLAARFRAVTFDNRDTARSEKPDAPYTVRDLAGDVDALLEMLEIDRAHVIGASGGGFIAQEFALSYPDRVRSLVLCCTSPGGPDAEPIPAETLALLASRTGDPERDLRAFLAIQVATDYLEVHADEVDAYVAWRIAHPQPLPSYHRQLAAFVGHDAGARLPGLRTPALILHGAHDRVVPARNGRLLAERIPGARLHIFEDAGHLFLWERAAEANRLITEFLAEV
jgi:pimeloyl-ACP methyl ester carboxylesterase